jgi:hypothetical protein
MKRSEKQPPPLGETRLNQQAIGEGLRKMFEQDVSQPVPEEFLDLLRLADERLEKTHLEKTQRGEGRDTDSER